MLLSVGELQSLSLFNQREKGKLICSLLNVGGPADHLREASRTTLAKEVRSDALESF
jgi:hypothetical protein